ncbi:hypothetical protein RV12_GL001473 [Enterococcus quebecensis]|nr:hypothetical protein RV12_GL001473 [Enterococcus quebecensis]
MVLATNAKTNMLEFSHQLVDKKIIPYSRVYGLGGYLNEQPRTKRLFRSP